MIELPLDLRQKSSGNQRKPSYDLLAIFGQLKMLGNLRKITVHLCCFYIIYRILHVCFWTQINILLFLILKVQCPSILT